MNPNNSNLSDVLGTLGETASKMTSFLGALEGSLTPEQKELVSKELGGTNALQEKMKEAQDKMTQALKDIQKFNI